MDGRSRDPRMDDHVDFPGSFDTDAIGVQNSNYPERNQNPNNGSSINNCKYYVPMTDYLPLC